VPGRSDTERPGRHVYTHYGSAWRTYPGRHGVSVGAAMMKVENEDREHHRQRTHRHDARKVDSCQQITASSGVTTLAASSEKRNVTVWCPSVSPSVCLSRRHTHRDSPEAAYDAASVHCVVWSRCGRALDLRLTGSIPSRSAFTWHRSTQPCIRARFDFSHPPISSAFINSLFRRLPQPHICKTLK